MNEKQAARWAAVRQMGRGKYVAIRGMLAWGVTLAAVFTLVEYLTQGSISFNWLVIRLFVFAVLGFFVASFRWDSKERKYARTAAGSKKGYKV